MKEIKSNNYLSLNKKAQFDDDYNDDELLPKRRGLDVTKSRKDEYDEEGISLIDSSSFAPNDLDSFKFPDESEFSDEKDMSAFEPYTLKELNIDKPKVVEQIKEFLKQHPNSSNLEVAQMFEVAPQHVSDIGEIIGVPVNKVAFKKKFIIEAGRKNRKKQDGTGPFEDSYQFKKHKKGKNKGNCSYNK